LTKKELQANDAFIKIAAMKGTFRNPPIYLTKSQELKAHVALEETPIDYRTTGTHMSFDFTRWKVPVGVRATLYQKSYKEWSNPLAKGDFIELAAELTGQLPIGSWGRLAALFVGQLRNRLGSKYKSSDVEDMITELKHGMSLMSGVNLPNRLGARIKVALRRDENGKYSFLYSRLFSIKGIEAYGAMALPGVMTAEYAFDKAEGKVLREWVGGKTLNYLFRKFTGLVGAGSHDEWFKYVYDRRKQYTPVFLSIFDQKTSAYKEYKNVCKDLEFHLQYGVHDEARRDVIRSKKLAFEKALNAFKASPSEVNYRLMIPLFTEFFAEFNNEVYKTKKARTYHIAV